ncbi:MAG: S8 family serine peptidase [Deltaproteobacteria bacterium]|nr:S8 family serine peptidase [Deltaproteobacteria bacterium]
MRLSILLTLATGLLLAASAAAGPRGKPLLLRAGPVEPADLPAIAADARAGVRVVQAEGSARGLLADLGARGVRILGYLPEDAYIVELDDPGALAGVPGLRWSGAVRPAWKRAGALARLDPHRAQRLRALGWPGVSFAGLAPRLETLGAITELRDDCTGTGHAEIRVEPGGLQAAIEGLTALDAVAWVDAERRVALANDDSTWVLQSGLVDQTPLFDHGLTGAGEVIGLADSGLDTDACQFRLSADPGAQTFHNTTQPPAVQVTDPGNKVITYYLFDGASPYDDRSKIGHGTHVTGCAAGDDYAHLATDGDPGRDPQDGMAPGARIVFQDIGRRDGNQTGLPSSLVDMYVQAYGSGARIHNNSFGKTDPDVAYSGDSREVDEAAWRMPDMLIVFSSGNLGPDPRSLDGIGSTSKNPIVVGASLSGARMGRGVCHFSSQGPCADGRLRPDVVAPGAILSALETDWIERGGTDIYGQPTADSTTETPNDNCAVDDYKRLGTSFSAPLVSGMAALCRQYFIAGYYPDGAPNAARGFVPSAALLKAVLVNSAQNINGKLYNVTDEFYEIADLAPAPTSVQGWGLVHLDRSLVFPGDREKLAVINDCWGDGTDRGAQSRPALQEGQVHSFGLEGVGAGQPLRLTLAWTDPAGSTGSGRALVNDLDLELEDGAGTLYRGNVGIVNSISTPAGGQGPDEIEPLEQILLSSPPAGELIVRVVARRVPGNGQSSPYPSSRQGYALVAVGGFEGVCLDPPCGQVDAGRDGGDGGAPDGDGAAAGDDGGAAGDDGHAPADGGGGGEADPDGFDGGGAVIGGCSCGAPGRGLWLGLLAAGLWLAARRRCR